MNYTGIKCPVCDVPFLENDDIVVCPSCGAPYHRACYEKTGHCLFEEKHGTGTAWEPPKVEAPNSETEPHSRRCPRCGYLNAESALFCNQCGESLTGGPEKEFKNRAYPPPYGNPNQQQPPVPPTGYPFGGIPQQPGRGPFVIDMMGGINPEEEIEGVKAGDLAKVVQANAPYYLPVFSNINRFHRSRFNFAAFAFSGCWLLYRKQYKIGAIITSIIAAIYLACMLISINFSSPILLDLLNTAGITDLYTMTNAQSAELLKAFYSLPIGDMLLFFVPLMGYGLQLIVMIICGVCGNRWYYRGCIERVKKIRVAYPLQEDFTLQLQAQGGVNMSIVLCYWVCYMIMTWLPQFMML